MKIGFFCKHEVAFESLKLFLTNFEVSLIVLDLNFKNNSWYDKIVNLTKKNKIDYLEVKRIKNHTTKIKSYNLDLVFSIMFTQVIPKEIIESVRIGIVNFHPSLLPKYRGPHPVNWAIINNEKETGLTVHFMNERVDAGDIIFSKTVKINQDDTLTDVSKKIMRLIPRSLLECYSLVENNELKVVKQDESLASYYPRRTEEDDEFDFEMSSVKIYNMVRTLTKPLPGAYFTYNNKKFHVFKALIIKSRHFAPGVVLDVKRNSITISAKDDNIILKDVTCEDRYLSDLREFFESGEKLCN